MFFWGILLKLALSSSLFAFEIDQNWTSIDNKLPNERINRLSPSSLTWSKRISFEGDEKLTHQKAREICHNMNARLPFPSDFKSHWGSDHTYPGILDRVNLEYSYDYNNNERYSFQGYVLTSLEGENAYDDEFNSYDYWTIDIDLEYSTRPVFSAYSLSLRYSSNPIRNSGLGYSYGPQTKKYARCVK